MDCDNSKIGWHKITGNVWQLRGYKTVENFSNDWDWENSFRFCSKECVIQFFSLKNNKEIKEINKRYQRHIAFKRGFDIMLVCQKCGSIWVEIKQVHNPNLAWDTERYVCEACGNVSDEFR